MTVMTRPEEGVPLPVTKPDGEEPAVMSGRLANALMTQASMSSSELHCAVRHYLALIKLLDVSGPYFASQRRQAVDMHNRAVRRVNGIREEIRRRAEEDDERLLEIER